jgi:hypothetical protein
MTLIYTPNTQQYPYARNKKKTKIYFDSPVHFPYDDLQELPGQLDRTQEIRTFIRKAGGEE